MVRIKTVLLSAVLLGPSSFAADAPSLEAFGRLPTLEDVAISPDGAKIAYVKTRGDSRNLVVASFAKNEILGGVHVGDTKLRRAEWIDDDNLLATVSTTSSPPIGFTGSLREWSQLVLFNVSKLKINALDFAVPNQRTINVVTGGTAVRELSGHSMLYAPGFCVTDRTVPCLFSFAIPQRRARLLEQGSQSHTGWLIDESGEMAARLVYDDDKKIWEVRTRQNGHWTLSATGTAAIDVPNVIGFSADGSALVVRFLENGEPIWKPLNLKDNSWGPPLARGEAFAGIVEDRKSGRILGGVHEQGSSEYVFFDNELQARWNAVLRAFVDERVRLISHSDDFSRIVVRVFGPAHGCVYALYDWCTHRATVLGEVYEQVTTPAEVKAISYQASDGMTIPGFLTLPRAASEKDLPLIVLPHGGPALSDTLDFDWWARALAAQGYAVLQPNFRGSSLSTRFIEAGFGEWGRKMQSDLSDGVRFLAKLGTIDPKRVCIVGASYGGYSALAGVTIESGVYRCAVSVAGLCDLRRFRKWTIENQLSLTQRYWDRFMALPTRTIRLFLRSRLSSTWAPYPCRCYSSTDATTLPFLTSRVLSC